MSHKTRPIATALAALALLATPVAAQAAGDGPPQRLITITGSGEVSAAPDQAELSAGVVSQARTAAAALADNSRKMNAVFAAIRKLGVPDKAIQTSNFSVSPQYPPYNSKEERRITGYQVSNTVTVKLDDLKKLGPALDALVSAGANQINNVGFSIRDPKPLLAKAREAAVKDATEEARTYASAAGVSLGPIQSISESGGTGPRPMIRAMAMEAAAPPPIAAGEQTRERHRDNHLADALMAPQPAPGRARAAPSRPIWRRADW